MAHVSLECVESELVITCCVPYADESAAALAPGGARAFVDAERGEPEDTALYGLQVRGGGCAGSGIRCRGGEWECLQICGGAVGWLQRRARRPSRVRRGVSCWRDARRMRRASLPPLTTPPRVAPPPYAVGAAARPSAPPRDRRRRRTTVGTSTPPSAPSHDRRRRRVMSGAASLVPRRRLERVWRRGDRRDCGRPRGGVVTTRALW